MQKAIFNGKIIDKNKATISIFLYPFKSKLSQAELMAGDEKGKFLRSLADWSEVDEEYAEEIKNGRIDATLSF